MWVILCKHLVLIQFDCTYPFGDFRPSRVFVICLWKVFVLFVSNVLFRYVRCDLKIVAQFKKKIVLMSLFRQCLQLICKLNGHVFLRSTVLRNRTAVFCEWQCEPNPPTPPHVLPSEKQGLTRNSGCASLGKHAHLKLFDAICSPYKCYCSKNHQKRTFKLSWKKSPCKKSFWVVHSSCFAATPWRENSNSTQEHSYS